MIIVAKGACLASFCGILAKSPCSQACTKVGLVHCCLCIFAQDLPGVFNVSISFIFSKFLTEFSTVRTPNGKFGQPSVTLLTNLFGQVAYCRANYE